MKGKTIFITGGNAGIGFATAMLFAKEGANVAIFSRRPEQNSAAREKVEAAGARCLAIEGDVVDEQSVRRGLKRVMETFGALHFAFNNAGVEQVPTPFLDQTAADYRRIVDVNVMGVWLCMREEIPLIQKAGGGCIVNTSSVAGLIGMAQVPLYIAAKHAVLGLTKSVALEYAKEGVRINAVCPAAVRTDLYERFTGKDPEFEKAIEAMHPMGRSGSPEEVASGVLYLCRDATWTTGQALVMDGGFTAA